MVNLGVGEGNIFNDNKINTHYTENGPVQTYVGMLMSSCWKKVDGRVGRKLWLCWVYVMVKLE